MDLYRTTMNTDLTSNFDAPFPRAHDNDSKQSDSLELLCSHLKQNYRERIQSLERQVQAIYKEVQSDRSLKSMGKNNATNSFKKHKIQDIVHSSLLLEKEAQIEALIETNSCLRAELQELQEGAHNLAQSSLNNINSLQASADEFSCKWKEERAFTIRLKQEIEELKEQLYEWKGERDSIILQNKINIAKNDQKLQNTAYLESELEDLRRSNMLLEQGCAEKDKILEDLKQDRDRVFRQFREIEESNSRLKIENYRMGASLKEAELVNEKNKEYETEIQEMRNQLELVQNELGETQDKLKNALEIANSTMLSMEEQNILSEKIEGIKRKYKQKIEKLKEKIKQLEFANEDLNNQKFELNQLREKNKTQIEQEIKDLKEKYSKLEVNHQKEMVELKSQYQVQVAQLENERRIIFETRQGEMYNGSFASGNFSKSRNNVEFDSRMRLENSLIQIEKNYILKSKHESVLEVEKWDLKAKHGKELQKLNEEFEKNLNRKLKDAQEKEKAECEQVIRKIKDEKKVMEDELEHAREDIRKLNRKQDENYQIIKNLKLELEDAFKKPTELNTNLNEVTHTLATLQVLYDSEIKRAAKIEEMNKELTKSGEDVLKRKSEIQQLNRQLEENKHSIEQITKKLEQSNEENAYIRKELEDNNQEKQTLKNKLEDVKAELEKTIQKSRIESKRNEAALKDVIIQSERQQKDKLEITIIGLQQREKDLRTELVSVREECKSLNGKITRQRTDFGEKVKKIWKNAIAEVTILRKQIGTLRFNAVSLVENSRDSIKEDVLSLLQAFNMKLKNVKAQQDETERKKTENHQKEVAKYEKTLESYINENVDLNSEVNKLNKHVTTTLNTLEEAKSLLSDYSNKLEFLQKEKAGLTSLNNQMKKELQQSQNIINSEIKKVKEEVHVSLPEALKQLKLQYSSDSARAMRELEEFKLFKLSKLKNLEESVAEVQNNHEEGLKENREAYLKRVGQHEAKMVEIKANLDNQVHENACLREELAKLRDKYQKLERENLRAIGSYQDKIDGIQELTNEENNLAKLEKEKIIKENHHLHKSLKGLKEKLEMCDLEIDSLTRVRSDQQECIMKYKNLLDAKKKLNGEQNVKFKAY